jgi:ribulose 1,5-bisphosphate synthetase/thiazole synthase
MAPSLEHTVSNGVNATTWEFELKDAPVENFRPMKVIVIGAGFSGIYCGIRIPQRLRNIDLTIYEKNEGVGGTWWENRYPGCACDVPGLSPPRRS